MIASELVTAGLSRLAALASTHAHLGSILADPTPPGQNGGPPAGINTSGVISFILSKIAPIMLAILGVIFIARANKGEVSRVLTSSAIAIIGLVFIGGAVTLLFLGDYLIKLIFQ